MKLSASLLFLTGGESARLRRDPQYRNYQTAGYQNQGLETAGYQTAGYQTAGYQNQDYRTVGSQAELNQYDQFGNPLYMSERNSRFSNFDDLASLNDDLGMLSDGHAIQDYLDNNDGMYNDDLDSFGYGGSKKEYYPIDITKGDKYGNSVQYQTFGRIDDSADEWIDDDLLSTVGSRTVGTAGTVDRTYGSRDRSLDFLDVEDDNEDIFNNYDALELLTASPQMIDDDEQELENEIAMDLALNVFQNELKNERLVDNALGYAEMMNRRPALDIGDIFDDEEDEDEDEDEDDNDDLLFDNGLFDDDEDEDEDDNDSVNNLMNEIRILDLVEELDSRQL